MDHKSSQRQKLVNMVGAKLTDERHTFRRDKAMQRAGVGPDYLDPAANPRSEQAPQMPEDKHMPNYNNDTPNSWLRGRNESAEGKPNFDRMQSRHPIPSTPAAEGPGARQSGDPKARPATYTGWARERGG
jgi:hypothetical protein